MSLWCDKYRPKNFSELDFGAKQSQQLQRMVKEGDFPHLLIWGSNGAGKEIRIKYVFEKFQTIFEKNFDF